MARPRTPAAETPPLALSAPPEPEVAVEPVVDTRTFGDEGPPVVTSEDLDQIRKLAFEDGVAEGIRRATVKQLPLFEQAKQLARELKAESVETLRARIEELQDERGEVLVRSDLDLVLGLHRRLRAHQAQRDEALREPGRPRRAIPSERQPKPTEYEHIS